MSAAKIVHRPQQLTNRVIMVSPDHFGFNPQTAESNVFQNRPHNETVARDTALKEFAEMVNTLRNAGIQVSVLPSRTAVVTPDANFPNNWFSIHENKNRRGGSIVVLYPMLTPNRREERQGAELRSALTELGISSEIIDLSTDENKGNILEGTGSMVLDRINRIAYAMESARTTKEEFDKWLEIMDYDGVFFHAVDNQTKNPVYHTNVVMSVGDGFSVLCSEAIPDPQERAMVENRLQENGELISITQEQMRKFAGNILHLKSLNGEPKIVMSQTAYGAFTSAQREQLGKYGTLVPVTISTIENVGGGSARCMIAEVFPPEE